MFLQLLASGLVTGAIYGLVSMGFILIYKASRVFNLAQGEMVMLGGLLAWAGVNQLHLPPWATILFIIVAAVVLGLVVERFTMRPLIGKPILTLIMMCIAISLFLRGIASLLWPIEHAFPSGFLPRGMMALGSVRISYPLLFGFIASVLVLIILTLFFKYTRTGLAMRVQADDQQVAQSLGLNVKRLMAYTWSIAALVAVVGGFFLAPVAGVGPGLAMAGLKALPVVLLAGLESIPGAFVAGLIVGVGEFMAVGYLNDITKGGMGDLFPFALMLVILMIRPYGLFGEQRIERV
ncbi:branched-chain amino acid ABC transporter permease [Chloroflexota bacterium]